MSGTPTERERTEIARRSALALERIAVALEALTAPHPAATRSAPRTTPEPSGSGEHHPHDRQDEPMADQSNSPTRLYKDPASVRWFSEKPLPSITVDYLSDQAEVVRLRNRRA